jgi:hypothetical protein
MEGIELIGTGVVYRNPDPDLKPRHAWHPTLALVGGGRWVCSFDLASAILDTDYATHLAWSADDGATWSEPARLATAEPEGGPDTHSVRITRLPDGSFVAGGARWRRTGRHARGLNRETGGWCPMDLVITRSLDGRTWSPLETIGPPLRGPAFEVCHRIVPLDDGRWLWPMSTWRGWDGDAGDGERAVALVSYDEGRTWPEYLTVLDSRADGIVHWEQSLVALPGHRLLDVAWAFDPVRSVTHELPYAIAPDGRTFSVRGLTGLRAQTTKVVSLGDGRIVAIYRRDDVPGLWATLAGIDGDRWVRMADLSLMAFASSGMTGHASVADELGSLAFGSPSPVLAEDGTVLAAFWCRESCVYGIRWVRLRITG